MSSSEPPSPPAPGDEDDISELSGFDRIQNNFKDLKRLICEICDAFGRTPSDVNSNSGSGTANGVDPAPAPVADRVDTNPGRRMDIVREDMKHIRKNVEYIKNNVEQLKSSSYSDGAEELLWYLMDAAEKRTVDDFPADSDNLKHLLHMIAKLKQLVPPHYRVAEVYKERKTSPIVSMGWEDKAVTDMVNTLVSYQPKDWGMDGLLKSYGELKVRDKLCLLCFSVFFCFVNRIRKEEEEFLVQKNLVIKKKILIYWWVGEGFIQPIHSSNKNSTTNTVPQNIPTPDTVGPSLSSNPVTSTNAVPQGTPIPELAQNSADQNHNPTTNPSSNPDSSTNADPQGNPNPNHSPIIDGNQIFEQVWPPPEDEGKTIEEIGEYILNVLREKGFIEPVMKMGRETGSFQMLPFVHAFVTALAKKDGFFDFSDVDGKLTHRFSLSQRACLVKSQGELSSCRIWNKAIDNRDALKKFTTVQTLFNFNETMIDIQPEWFSKMKYLSVLHLGSWYSEAGEYIEVEDPKFMEELKNMKRLKLFSLQGVATIMKLPDSVCKLSNLIILDLRECHNLEQLPAKIGELKNLTHLDLTNCHLVTKLPIGISLLSKLQVLNWFAIYNQDGEKEVQKGCMSKAWKKTKGYVVHDVFRYENKKVCTLKDLLKLGSLRKLSIVVNRNDFPSQYEAEVLMKMRELCTLKITWVDFNDTNKDTNSIEPVREVQPSSKCGSCFCCKKSEENPQEAQDTSQMRFEKLEKLKLCCFSGEQLPDWLVPDKLKKLKKLYIKGGKLASLGADNITWNVETLSLKYMKELKIEWRELIAKFPKMTYLEKFQCKQLGLFPCDHEGVWINKEKIANCAV